MTDDKLCKLRNAMKEQQIDCYLIPTSDDHDSEYVSEHFQVRKYFSGFTGSAGTLLVTEEEAALFTDGRYFIQAKKELAGTQIRLMKAGEPGVPTIKEYLEQKLKQGQNLGFDGRVVTAKQAREYEAIVAKKQGKLLWQQDLADGIWQERPMLCHEPAFVLPIEYSGESTESKLARVREKMNEITADIYLLTVLDDIAWLFNLRGNDIENCPVVLSYAAVTRQEVLLFAKESAFSKEGKEYLAANHIELRPYEEFYAYAKGLQKERVCLCLERANYFLYQSLGEQVALLDQQNPTQLMKAVKNAVEMENLRKAHIRDGLAVTRFMYWLKRNIGRIPITEISAAEVLEELRRQQEHFIEPSFETICAYGANGAIIHYSASPENCARLEEQGLLMVDSGGHYLEGSTDVTRTFVLGPVTEEMKKHFTLVLRAMLHLKNTRFLYGCRGVNLDIRAREILWEEGLDYKHGTGHGVGYLLNVHEGPNSFRWKYIGDLSESAVLEEGMVTTDEPGIYIEGSHGIRIENELLCRRGEKNEYGQFMYFENLTYVPIDLDAVEVSLLEEKEKRWLNAYHSEVYEKLSPYLEGEELAFLRKATREI